MTAPTDDAYLAACRALNWRTAELHANGIDPLQLTDDMPHSPPDDYEFPKRTTTIGEVAVNRRITPGAQAFLDANALSPIIGSWPLGGSLDLGMSYRLATGRVFDILIGDLVSLRLAGVALAYAPRP